jgi:amidohydrolase
LLLAVLLAARAALAGEPATATREGRIAAAAESLRARLIEVRRDLHRHPELSNREERTARLVADRLGALGLDEVKTNVAGHGVTALLRGGKPGPVVALRADMDALPIEETLEVPYKSLNRGVKHACGHDAHTAIELGVAEVLGGLRADLPGTVKFIFQPAEEGPPPGEEGGAPLMIKQGALENPRPEAIFGLHVAADVPVGQVGYCPGAALASADHFVITIRGKMSHGAWPQEGVDAVVVAAECVLALQTIHSRRLDTREPSVLSVGSIHGGNRSNIIADEVRLEGTVRALSEGTRQRIKELMRNTLAGVTTAHGARFEFNYQEGDPITYNEPKLVEECLPVMRRVLGQTNVVARKPVMGAEDFSFYQQVIPGFYYWLGVANQSRGITAMIHTPEFDVDEECLVIGVKVMANLALDFLERRAGER